MSTTIQSLYWPISKSVSDWLERSRRLPFIGVVASAQPASLLDDGVMRLLPNSYISVHIQLDTEKRFIARPLLDKDRIH